MSDAIVSDLGRRLFVQIDPAWPWVEYAISNSPNSSTKLSATFMDLEQGITESATVRYTDIDIVGRAEPIKVWTGNASREVSLMFRFRAQGANMPNAELGGVGRPSSPRGLPSDQPTARQESINNSIAATLYSEVQAPAKFIDWLRYPYIDDLGISHGPPPLYLSIGRLLRMRCVVVACAITWVPPFDVNTMLPHGADVAVTFASTTERIGNYNPAGPVRIQPNSIVPGLDTL